MEKTKKMNPAPLGLLGFGMTTILLNLHNAGIIELTAMIAAMGFAMGGIAQIIAGLLEWKEGNTFGGVAFTAYGLFWWSLVFIWATPFDLTGADKISMGYYLVVWGLFTTMMFIGTLKHNTISKIVFGSLAVLFFLLALGDFTGSETITVIAGIIGLVCGFSACYSAAGQILNNEFGKDILPL